MRLRALVTLTEPARRRALPRVLGALLLLAAAARTAQAQVRERPVAFDSAGRVLAITPPLAARLGLSAPLWPVEGDYVDARLYATDDSSRGFVIVARRQRDVLERFPIDAARRAELARVVERGTSLAAAGARPDSAPTYISEPVRGTFVATQTGLGALLFGPAAAGLTGDAAAGTAAYLLVAGSSFFLSADLTRTHPVSRAQNHLSAHSAWRGAIAANLGLYALAGNGVDDRAYAAATLLGGIAGDVIGFELAKPMTDAEAHGTAHGSTVTAALTAGLLGAAGAYSNDGSGRAAAAAIVGAGALGYPLGLRYVRGASYRVTAGDVGAMFTSELLGLGAAAAFVADGDVSDEVAFGALTAGYAIGAIAGDRLLVRPFDHTESDARLLALGTGAGAVMGLAVPVLAQSGSARLVFATATAGGILGAMLTEHLIEPARAGFGVPMRSGSRGTGGPPSRVGVQFAPESALLAGMGVAGRHSILSLSF
jgi:hypothetical protein